jgi:hypothetical protein
VPTGLTASLTLVWIACVQNSAQVQSALKSVLGKHKSKFADIPFPAPVPSPPPVEQRHILVAVLSGYGQWDAHTLPLLEYLTTCPDAIDTVVVENPREVTWSHCP